MGLGKISESLAGHMSETKKAKTIAGAYSIDIVAEFSSVNSGNFSRAGRSAFIKSAVAG